MSAAMSAAMSCHADCCSRNQTCRSAGRHAHPIEFTVRVSRDKFDRYADSLVLQPSLVTVNGEVFVEYKGTLPLLHAHWRRKEGVKIRSDVYDHFNDYDQVVSTSVDMKIVSNSKVIPEIIDLTQECKTIEIPSEDDDQILDVDSDEQYRQTERRSSMFGFANYLQFPPSQFPSEEELRAAEHANSLQEPVYSDIEEGPEYNGELP